jgi:hypothetical protein
MRARAILSLFAVLVSQFSPALANNVGDNFEFRNAETQLRLGGTSQTWKIQEKILVQALLEKACNKAPKLIDKAAHNPLLLYRTPRLETEKNGKVICSTDGRCMYFADSFFETSFKERRAFAIFHELVHSSDYLHTIAFSPDWLTYYASLPHATSQSQENTAVESLSDICADYYLGKDIPKRSFFEKKILPLFETKSPKEDAAKAHFFKAQDLLLHDELNEAKSELEFAIRMLPNVPGPRILLVIVSELKKDHSSAIKELNECQPLVANLPSNEKEKLDYLEWKAITLAEGFHDYKQAKHLREQVLRAKPNAESLRRLMNHYERKEKAAANGHN